jgi:catechol 2,3-dioxygenase-like lactoylglutathione lyase family enzyme
VTVSVTHTDFVTVFVKDFEAASRFYRDVLGLEHSTKYGSLPGGEFETGNVTLQVMESAAVGIEFQPSRHPIALRVDDVAAARGELEEHGIPFMGDTIDSGVCHMAFFEDPDGNTLMLHHRYAPRD